MMKDSYTWKNRCFCWFMILCLLFSMPVSSFGEGEEHLEGAEEVVAVVEEVTAAPTESPATPEPTEAPTQAPTEEPTQAPTEKPTEEPTQAPTEKPTEEPTQAPVEESTQEPPAAPQEEEPTQNPTDAPAVTDVPEATPEIAPETQEPEEEATPAPEAPVAYVGYAQITKAAQTYLGEKDTKEAYTLPRGTIVYVDGVLLEEVERAFVSYSIDGKQAGGYVEVSKLEGISTEAQDRFKQKMKKEQTTVYYDVQQEIPLQDVVPVYPEAAAEEAPADATAAVTAVEIVDIEKLEEAREEGTLQKTKVGDAKARVQKALSSVETKDTPVYFCTNVSQMQSAHPYANYTEEVYVYQQANAAYISVTFSSDTFVEKNYDFIGLADVHGNVIGVYTGADLAGKTIRIPGNTVQIVLLTDVSNTAYGFRVTKLDAYTKPAAAPTAEGMGKTSVRLTWKLPAGIAGYDVYRSDSSNGTYVRLGTTTSSTYTATVPAGKISYFKIRAYSKIDGTAYLTGYSAARSAYPLATPTISSVTKAAANKMKVQWSAVSGATKYQVYHSNQLSGTYKLLATTSATNNTFTLDKTKAHYFKVRAVKTSGSATFYSQFSAAKSGVFSLKKAKLNQPTVLGKTKVQLSWAEISGATGYQVYRKAGSGFVMVGETSRLTYTDSKCPTGKVVTYKIRAFSAMGSSRVYGKFSAVRKTFAMGVATLKNTRTGSNNKLTWAKVANISGYYVYRSNSENGTYKKIATVSKSKRTYTDKSVGSGYFYKVRPYKTVSGKTYLGPESAVVKAGPKYRALLVGNLYSGANKLNGPGNDTSGMSAMLGRMKMTPYAVTRKTNQSASGIISQIKGSAFAGAQKDDVSLFYYSGHGAAGGQLVGNDLNSISPSQLRAALDTVPGKKIVIIDACNSGGVIGKTTKAANDSFTEGFIREFSSKTRASNNLADSNYYVITAAHSSQYSIESTFQGFGDKAVGVFTFALCYGAGRDYLSNSNTSFYADRNNNGTLTLQEVYSFSNAFQQEILSGYNISAQVYPTNSGFTLFSYK